LYICKRNQKQKLTNLKLKKMEATTIEKKATELKKINFFVGGLTDEAINYYYQKLILKTI
jgi:hypothetical protein